jgi:hypothetical protein
VEDRLTCLEKINDILEPETGIPIIKLGLIRVEDDKTKMKITYIPPSPYTSPLFVIMVCISIIEKLINNCNNFSLEVENYYLSQEINKRLRLMLDEYSRILS